jgi:hypothetical protein
VERMHKKLNNQIKQLRLLIKLMLNSDSALLRSRQWIRRYSGLQLPYGLTALQPSLKNNIKNKADQEQKREWVIEIERSTKLPTVLTQTTVTNIIENFALASDLLKWSVLLIAESLAPLKKKHEYYSLIFIKILKSRGFLTLIKKKQNNSATVKPTAVEQGGLANDHVAKEKPKAFHFNLNSYKKQQIKIAEAGTKAAKAAKTAKNLRSKGLSVPFSFSALANNKSLQTFDQVKTNLTSQKLQDKVSLTKKNRVLALTESDTNKIPLVTFYPGGRYTRD